MERIETLATTITARTAAYEEQGKARAAFSAAERLLLSASRDAALYCPHDPVLSASLKGREAIAMIRLEEARERLAEACRDLQRARLLAEPDLTKELEIEID